VEDDDLSKATDVFIFEYSSPYLKNANKLSDLSEQLRGALEDNRVWDHQKVIFVAHSMGGLIVRQFLISNSDKVKNVPMLYFFSVPTDGAAVTQVASRLSNNPQLKGMLPLDGNDFLNSVRSDWIGTPLLKQLKTHCAFESLETDGVLIVSQSSVLALCTEKPDPMAANHIDIVKPDGRYDPRFTRMLTAIKETYPEANTLPLKPPVAVVLKPDISLKIYGTKRFTVVVENNSQVLLREPKYWLGVLNLTKAVHEGHPVAVPLVTFTGDWIRSGGFMGPNEALGANLAASSISPGDVLVGRIGATCPECRKDKIYWIYYVVDSGGWYSQGPEKLTGKTVEDMLAQIPESTRVAITDWPPHSK
jgi:Lecithin:cholesterol acyltransferase